MPATYDEFTEEYIKDLEKGWAKTKISIMVLGPDLNGTTVGARLRQHIVQRCDQVHGIAIKGEHGRLIKQYKRIVGRGGNLATHELGLAKKVDALVVIPDSPGSLVELGMFALEGAIAQKSLILIQAKYNHKEDSSFIQLGPNVAYKAWGAHIEYVNFRKKASIWKTVDEFLLRFRALKYNQSLHDKTA